MFRETLLESSSSGRKGKRWPMMVAFALEVLVGLALIGLPLLSTGVIPVSARVSIIAPLGRPNATRPPDGHPSTGGVSVPRTVALNVERICLVCPARVEDSGPAGDHDTGPPTIGSPTGLPGGLADSHSDGVVPEPEQPQPPKRIRVSVISEGQLMNKVEPVYPRIAIITGTKGDVRLHAIIAKDGTIQSLTVVSGPPLLIPAARDAVSQWRYRPYLLNGQPVEVETFITVSFKGIRD
jgi:periplasmic protein TonB